MKPYNAHGISRRWLGVAMTVAAALAVEAQTAVTYQVDMSTEPLGTPTAVYVTGTPSGMNWDEFPAAFTLTNVSGTIWSGTFIDTNPVGTVEQVKFNDNLTGWEPSANRQFLLGTTGTVGPGTQVLPLATWNSASTWPTPTNQVTFQVDMSAQVVLGAFIPGTGTITVSGDLIGGGWDNGWPLTNNTELAGNASNIYSAPIPIAGFAGGTSVNYKFRMNGGWESVDNRGASITNSTQVLPLVYYNNNSVYDLVQSNTTVQFSIYVPDQAALGNGGIFTKGVDTIAVNGNWIPWWGWGVNAAPAQYQMIQVGTSDVYTNSVVIPKGSSLTLTYKYGIDGLDNENGFNTNHVRVIRSYGPAYVFPQDTWSLMVCPPGTPYPNPGITSTNIVEPDFGYLTIQGIPHVPTLPITWLGRPGVLLQNVSTLSGGIWTDNSATDGLQATNWPNAGGNQFFRLKKKQ